MSVKRRREKENQAIGHHEGFLLFLICFGSAYVGACKISFLLYEVLSHMIMI